MKSTDVIVVGAGLAGLAVASALTSTGAKVLLLERRPFVGGRAYSYEHPALHEEIDSQHVLLGCCTNLRSLCADAGIADRIRWYKEFTFLEPDGRRTTLAPGALPGPMHNAVGFLRAPMLSLTDKAAIARGLVHFVRGYPKHDDEIFASWLKRTGQTERAIRHLWRPVIVSALNDTLENCSLKYAGQVFYESFLKSAEGGWMGFPTEPLSSFYMRAAEHCVQQGAELRMEDSVTSLQHDAGSGMWAVQTNERCFSAASVVLATPSQETVRLLPDGPARAQVQASLAHFRNAPITTVHLWFDREFTQLDHAALLDTTIEWMFHKSRIRRWPAERGSYMELTISASFAQLHQSREEILSTALRELEMFFPAVHEAKLIKSGILKEARATFSVTPGLDAHRPTQETAWPGLYLAGDWTATDWPSTMEGAVRSGYLAAEAISRASGQARTFLKPDLPPSGLMKLLAR